MFASRTVSGLAILFLSATISAPAMANDAREQAQKIARLQGQCSAYYLHYEKDSERAQRFLENVQNIIQVHSKSTADSARSEAIKFRNQIHQEIKTNKNGNYNDLTIPLRYKTYCPQIDPALNAKVKMTAPASPKPVANSGAITIKMLTGKKIAIENWKGTVLDLKKQIEIKEGIPPEQQRLIFAGRQMEDDKNVAAYRLHSGSTVHLVLRLSDY